MELPFGKYSTSAQRTPSIFILLILAVVVLGLIPLYHPFNWYSGGLIIRNPSEISPTYFPFEEQKIAIKEADKCDVFSGKWIWNPDAPYYTNVTCTEIHDHQNCMKHGRPDSDYLKWRWKPNGCELPIFNPFQFLDLVRNMSLAIVGDSVGRNQMQSLICLLSRVEYPVDISDNPDQSFKKYKYTTYNFTLAIYWSPFLVSTKEVDADGPCHTGLYNLYLDEADEKWTTKIEGYDYIILNAGHWFARCSVYYVNNQRVGCRYCGIPNVTELPSTYAYQRAFKTTLKAINNLENFKGVAILRTFAPSHYEGGNWNEGGDCARTRPYGSNETALEDQSMEQYRIQVEEFQVAEKEGKTKGKRFRLMDTTRAMLLRPDGHPSKYGHWPNENVANDCVHWCLPGPIDSWSDFLFHMFKMEAIRSLEENLQ